MIYFIPSPNHNNLSFVPTIKIYNKIFRALKKVFYLKIICTKCDKLLTIYTTVTTAQGTNIYESPTTEFNKI